MQRILLVLTAFAALGGCTWETYQDSSGSTRLRQKYPAGSGIYYTEGAASQNTRYHGNRPVQHAVLPEPKDAAPARPQAGSDSETAY